MITMLATALDDLAAVRIELEGVPDGPVPITRTDANGTAAVRQLPDQVASAGLLAVVDYEPALTGPVAYAVDDAGTVVSVVVELTAETVHVHVPIRPQLRAQAVALVEYDETTRPGTITHQILDADRPLPIGRPGTGRAGRVRLRTDTYQAAATIRDVATTGDEIQVRQLDFPGLDLYATVTAARVGPITEDAADVKPWAVDLDYQETAPPAGGLLGAAAWTVADLAATVPTVADVPLTFPTVYELTVGPR